MIVVLHIRLEFSVLLSDECEVIWTYSRRIQNPKFAGGEYDNWPHHLIQGSKPPQNAGGECPDNFTLVFLVIKKDGVNFGVMFVVTLVLLRVI